MIGTTNGNTDGHSFETVIGTSNGYSTGASNGISNGQTNDTNGTAIKGGSGNGLSNGIKAAALPDANSENLILTTATEEERRIIWSRNSTEWGGALSVDDYLQREEYVTTTSPLTRDGGITHWVLVDKTLPKNQRPILSCAESIRKRAWIKTPASNEIKEVLTHGIGGVFCFPEHRGHGYASRMMTDLGKALGTHQATEDVKVGFSVLWSDIGKKFYTKHGWHAFPSTHVEFPPAIEGAGEVEGVKLLRANDLPKLCKEDESLIKQAMAKANDGKTHVAVAPDASQMEWHRSREAFLTKNLFGKTPDTRGALVGVSGERVWVVWTRAYYGKLDAPKAGNTLHILRLVIEDEDKEQTEERVQRQAESLKLCLKAAQKEAVEWKLKHVELWNPSQLVQKLINKIDIEHNPVERETSSIPSLMWYGEGDSTADEIVWVENEKFCWC